MLKWCLSLLILSGSVLAHEVQFQTQHIDIQRQNLTGWQHDVLVKTALSRKYDFGLQATNLERFGLHENRIGAFLSYKPKDSLLFEVRYLKGEDNNQILPTDQYNVSAYWAMVQGLSPYLIYRDVKYNVTHLQIVNLGLEIEKFRGFVLIPQITGGKATSDRPAQTQDVYNYGLRAIYYQEKIFSITAFAYKGREASQGVVGRPNFAIETLSGGIGAGYYFLPNIKAELSVDHTDYKELKNQFLTTTLNLRWVF